MKDKEYTCGNCQHVTVTGAWRIIGCSLTGFVIPHTVNYESGHVVFTRLPVECPRDDESVVRSEKPAASKHHIEKNISELPIDLGGGR